MLRIQCGVNMISVLKLFTGWSGTGGKQTSKPMTDIRARREAATEEEYQIEQGISQCFPGVITRKGTEALAW